MKRRFSSLMSASLHPLPQTPFQGAFYVCGELRNIYHHHPESKKRKSSEANSGSSHPYGGYRNAVETRKAISTLGGRFGYFLFFPARERGRGSLERPGRGRGRVFYLKVQGGGGVSRGGGGGTRGPRGGLQRISGAKKRGF